MTASSDLVARKAFFNETLIAQLATYFSGSNVAAASIGLQLGGYSMTQAQPYFVMREACGITGYMTRDEAADAIRATLAKHGSS